MDINDINAHQIDQLVYGGVRFNLRMRSCHDGVWRALTDCRVPLVVKLRVLDTVRLVVTPQLSGMQAFKEVTP